MMATGSREAMLGRIREACGAARGASAVERGYRQRGELSPEERVALMIERLREYDADVMECAPAEIEGAIARVIQAGGRRVVTAPQGLAQEWLAQRFEWKLDAGLSYDEVEHADGVVTAATCAIAESGTIVLHHGPGEGRRVLTLLPDWHLCVLRASQVVETLPEYFERCGKAPALATFISGPSATADIEMTRIKGVHGPRFLSVLLVRDGMDATEMGRTKAKGAS